MANAIQPPFEIKEVFSYSKGELVWLHNGKLAGWICHERGYRVLSYKGKRYFAHRLIWFLHFGFTELKIDHKNRNKTDNRLKNLRAVTDAQSSYNTLRKNVSGFKGVTYSKRTENYFARIKFEGEMKHLGTFKNAEDAAKAYDKESKRLHGKFGITNF